MAALAAAQEHTRCSRESAPGHPLARLPEAIVLAESGRFREAAAIYHSIATLLQIDTVQRSKVARNRAWFLTHEASALVGAGDSGAPARWPTPSKRSGPAAPTAVTGSCTTTCAA